jgi:glycosyltransferase involved in cell wall biosynthesis
LVESVERRLSSSIGLNVMMSDIDSRKLRAIAPGAATLTVPNGVDTTVFAPTPGGVPEPATLLFLGPTYMFPNRDAVDWFLQEMWLLVRHRVPQARLHLVGKNRPGDRARHQNVDGVEWHGYVPDVKPYLDRSSCSIVPIRVGGGTRLKILDSWAMGTAVVSTSVGCEGLNTVDGENILIRDDPRAFADAVADVLTDESLRARLGAAGRKTAVAQYDWRVVGDTIIRGYRDLITSATG